MLFSFELKTRTNRRKETILQINDSHPYTCRPRRDGTGSAKKYGKNRRDTGIRAIDAVIKYVKERKTIEASLRGSVTAV